MLKVKEVEVRPEHRLALSFSDGTKGVVDFRPLLKRKAFKALKDPEVFGRARVDLGAVEWPGDVGVATETLYAMAHDLPAPTTLEQANANELEVSLRELRQLANVTQTEIAAALGVDQGQLSRFERQDDRLVSSLRNYVSALGGQLELVATIGKKRVTLRGV